MCGGTLSGDDVPSQESYVLECRGLLTFYIVDDGVNVVTQVNSKSNQTVIPQ
jgi:hypothetical protein